MRTVLAIALMIGLTAPAIAATSGAAPTPAGPSCGKTAEDCQKVVDAQAQQIATQAISIQALQQQRNSIRSAADDAEVVNFVGQQQAAKAASAQKAETPKK